jgi:hypothetical protein
MRTAVFALGFLFAVAELHAQQAAFPSAGPREDLSVRAGHMLKATNQARIAIRNGNIGAALRDVNEAQSYLRQVEAGAHGSTMIPVYQEFVSVSIIGPIQTEQQARKAGQSGTPPPAAATNGNAAVHQVAGDYTSVVVNTTVAQNNLAAAKTALERGQMKNADSALQDVQEGVEIQSSQAEMPLTRARENLILARSFARRNNWTEARNALTAASHALRNYENENGPHTQAAAQLQREIEDSAHDLAQNHAGILAKINQWWNQTADWSGYKLKAAAG